MTNERRPLRPDPAPRPSRWAWCPCGEQVQNWRRIPRPTSLTVLSGACEHGHRSTLILAPLRADERGGGA